MLQFAHLDQSASKRVRAHGGEPDIMATEREHTLAMRRVSRSITQATNAVMADAIPRIAEARAAGDKRKARRITRSAVSQIRRRVRGAVPPGRQSDMFAASAAKATGVTAARAEGDLDDPAMTRALGASIARENRAFIAENRRLSEKMLREHVRDVSRLINSVDSVGAMRAVVKTRNEIVVRRGDVIAADQVQKLAGSQDRARQVAAGVESYTWETQGDSRVRREHVARQGQVFAWDSPPDDGHPGEPINCRCRAVPVV